MIMKKDVFKKGRYFMSYEDTILDYIENASSFTTSDMQGAIEALVLTMKRDYQADLLEACKALLADIEYAIKQGAVKEGGYIGNRQIRNTRDAIKQAEAE